MITSFYHTIRDGLQDKLGPVLFQFPPRFHYEPERLARVLNQLDTGFKNVLEFRHPGWWCEEVYAALRQRGVTFCGMSYPGLPDEPVVTSPVVYYRFHGVPDLYRSSSVRRSCANLPKRSQPMKVYRKLGVILITMRRWQLFQMPAA